MRPRLFALAALCTLWAGLGGSRRASVAVRCLCVGPVDVTGGANQHEAERHVFDLVEISGESHHRDLWPDTERLVVGSRAAAVSAASRSI